MAAHVLDLVHVINSDRDDERLTWFREVNGHLPIVKQQAVDGASFDRDRLRDEGQIAESLPYSDAALGNALTHIELWRRALERRATITVAEDDTIFARDFLATANEFLQRLPDGWDIVLWGWSFQHYLWVEMPEGVSCKLEMNYNELRRNIIAFRAGRVMPTPIRLRHRFGKLAYTVSAEGAGKLLNSCLPLRDRLIPFPGFDVVVENTSIEFMMNACYPDMKAYVSIPPLAVSPYLSDERPRMPLNGREFLQSDFEGRIRRVNQASNAQLWSSQLALVWRDVITRLEDLGENGAIVRKLTRELLVLAPDSEAAEKAYLKWMKDDGLRGATPDPPIVYLIVSCEKYKQKALHLYEKIAPHFSPTFIVIGDEEIDEAVFGGPFLTVPAPDNYESLPKKVLEALVAVRREFGKVGALKMDDDAQFRTKPNRAKIRELVFSADYVGWSIVNHPGIGFRCHHIGKCQYLKDEPYSKRYRGPWTRGGLYYLGPKAVEFLVRDYVSFPNELAGEIYEDKLIADILSVHDIVPSENRLSETFGIAFPPHDETGPPPDPLMMIDWQSVIAMRGDEPRTKPATQQP